MKALGNGIPTGSLVSSSEGSLLKEEVRDMSFGLIRICFRVILLGFGSFVVVAVAVVVVVVVASASIHF